MAKQSAKRDEAKGDAATRTGGQGRKEIGTVRCAHSAPPGVGDLAEQMLLLPGLFR